MAQGTAKSDLFYCLLRPQSRPVAASAFYYLQTTYWNYELNRKEDVRPSGFATLQYQRDLCERFEAQPRLKVSDFIFV
jgi:hypothetical protein